MINRRAFLIGLPLALGACARMGSDGYLPAEPTIDPFYLSMYGPILNEPYPVAAVDLRQVDPRWWRQEVPYATAVRPGTVVIDTQAHYLYLTQEGGRAMRYGIGVGKDEALQFKGDATIGRRAVWPRWTPTRDMIARQPERYGPYAGGMAGGAENPLGARALYLYRNGQDTLFRLHGTIEPYTIGTNVSSGCVRLLNQDIIDLYGRVPTGTSVVVIS